VSSCIDPAKHRASHDLPGPSEPAGNKLPSWPLCYQPTVQGHSSRYRFIAFSIPGPAPDKNSQTQLEVFGFNSKGIKKAAKHKLHTTLHRHTLHFLSCGNIAFRLESAPLLFAIVNLGISGAGGGTLTSNFSFISQPTFTQLPWYI
jgi:hypothetical protein